MLEEEDSLPQLIIIDGGKGQLSSAMNSLKKLGIEKRVTVIGIAKGWKNYSSLATLIHFIWIRNLKP